MKKTVFRLRAVSLAIACLYGSLALANPLGGQVIAGAASMQTQGNTLTVTTGSARSIIDWQSFSIGSGEVTRFVQPSAASSVLNRVLAGEPSQLLGLLQSNGKVYLINPAGILVGKDARIDVAAFVGATLNLGNQDYLEGRFNFVESSGAASVKNAGTVRTPSGGSVYLVGPQVENSGLIDAPGGEVLLAAGHAVRLVDTGTPGVSVEVSGSDSRAVNLGQILASAGRIGLVGGLVGNAGLIDAGSVVREGGRIFLRATQKIELADESVVRAEGTQGGEILAKVASDGNLGGELVARGQLSVRGSVAGGLVETSAAQVDFGGAQVRVGPGGNWLIDPTDITVDAARAQSISGTLSSGGTVTLDTASAGSDAGNITINSVINVPKDTVVIRVNDPRYDGIYTRTIEVTRDAKLVLLADHSININADITTSSGKLDMVFDAARTSSGGTINLGNATLNANGGSINASGDRVVSSAQASLNGLFSNAGAVDVQSGRLVLLQGGSDSGSYTIADGATLEWASGNRTLQSASLVTGSGTLLLSGAHASFASGSALSVGSLTLSGGSLDFGTQGSAGIFNQSVGLDGSGALSVLDAWNPVSGVSLNARLILAAGSSTTLSDFNLQGRGILENQGQLSLAGTRIEPGYVNSGAGKLMLAGATTFAGPDFTFESGTVNLNGQSLTKDGGHFNWRGGLLQGTGRLVFSGGASLVLDGSGERALRDLDLPVAAMNLGAGSLDLQAGGRLLASGTTTIASGATLSISSGQFESTGSVVNQGTLTNNGVMTVSPDLSLLAGGVYKGSGVLNGNLVNQAGTVAPGNSPGAMTINGNFSQGALGTLLMELGGLEQGSAYDWLHVSGSASLGGTLTLALYGSYVPGTSSVFSLVNAGSLSGTFATVNFPAGYDFTLGYGPTSLGVNLPSQIGVGPDAPATSGIQTAGGVTAGQFYPQPPNLAGGSQSPEIVGGVRDLAVSPNSPFVAGTFEQEGVAGGVGTMSRENVYWPVATNLPFPLFNVRPSELDADKGGVFRLRRQFSICDTGI